MYKSKWHSVAVYNRKIAHASAVTLISIFTGSPTQALYCIPSVLQVIASNTLVVMFMQ